ncbi:hypothetical protein [Ochrobactrum sp. S1502_03]|uniref:DUF7768 domain-containing protein n=1 Tax=Ochrobactrum sp. S1502_03 TaxID=3108451 RepID=UPI0037C98FA6
MLEEAEDKAARAAVEGQHSNVRLREIYVDVDVPNTDNPDDVDWKIGSKIVFVEAEGFSNGGLVGVDSGKPAILDIQYVISRDRYERVKTRSAEIISCLPKPYNDIHQPLVIIETPYSGDVGANTEYARACLLDSLRRGEAPIASHLLHTQVLDDMQPDERSLGIEAGLAWYRVATKCVVYSDRGISGGMMRGIDRAGLHDVPVEYRSIEARAAA